MTAEPQQQQQEGQVYTHLLKLGDTSMGLRISFHVFTNDQDKAIEVEFNLDLNAKMTASGNKIKLVLLEGNNNK